MRRSAPGPFKLVSFKRGDRVELARNDAWWGAEARVGPRTFRMVSNDAARIAALLSGDVDAIENVPTADVAKIAADARFTVARQTSWRTIFWHMDQYRDVTPFATDKAGKPLAKNPFKDARVRLAISKAINRDAIVSRVMEGLAVPASNLVSPGIFGYDPTIKVEAYDPAGAKRLLAEAGLSRRLPADAARAEQPLRQRRADRRDGRRVAVARRHHDEGRDAARGRATCRTRAPANTRWRWSAGGRRSATTRFSNHLGTVDEKKGYGAWNFGRYEQSRGRSSLEHDFTLFDDQAREEAAQAVARSR